jgi:uncharacterized membrane protein YqaE (UPF0057 family)
MRLLIALLLPWLAFFTIGRPVAGLACLILQITLIGWIPAAIWAAYAVSQFHTNRKTLFSGSGVMAHHATSAATRAPSRALPRRRMLCTT